MTNEKQGAHQPEFENFIDDIYDLLKKFKDANEVIQKGLLSLLPGLDEQQKKIADKTINAIRKALEAFVDANPEAIPESIVQLQKFLKERNLLPDTKLSTLFGKISGIDKVEFIELLRKQVWDIGQMNTLVAKIKATGKISEKVWGMIWTRIQSQGIHLTPEIVKGIFSRSLFRNSTGLISLGQNGQMPSFFIESSDSVSRESGMLRIAAIPGYAVLQVSGMRPVSPTATEMESSVVNIESKDLHSAGLRDLSKGTPKISMEIYRLGEKKKWETPHLLWDSK